MEEQERINAIQKKIGYIEKRDDITNEIPLTTSISNIGLSEKVSNNLIRCGVRNLEELLSIDYEKLKFVRGLGRTGRNEILMCVHRLGYKLPNENLAIDYQSIERKAQGKILLEDLGLSGMARKALNRAGIYTMDDLENNIDKLDKIPNFGYRKKAIVETWLSDLNREKIGEEKDKLNQKTKNDELQQENNAIKQRIKEKRNLLEQYRMLIAEREQLLQQEQELDRELDQLRGEQHATTSKLTKTKNPGQ